VISTRPATEAETAAWHHDWERRLRAWYAKFDVSLAWSSQQLDRHLSLSRAAETSAALALVLDCHQVGTLAVSLIQQDGSPGVVISDIWIAPEHRRNGYSTAALRLAEAWAADHHAH